MAIAVAIAALGSSTVSSRGHSNTIMRGSHPLLAPARRFVYELRT